MKKYKKIVKYSYFGFVTYVHFNFKKGMNVTAEGDSILA